MFKRNYMACRIEEHKDRFGDPVYYVYDCDDGIVLTLGLYDDEDTVVVWEGKHDGVVKEFGPKTGANWKTAFKFLYSEACTRLLKGEAYFDEDEVPLTYEEQVEQRFPTTKGMLYLSLRNYGETGYDLGGFYSTNAKAFEAAFENLDLDGFDTALDYYDEISSEAYPIAVNNPGKKGDTVTLIFKESDPEDIELIVGVKADEDKVPGYVYLTAVLGTDHVSYSRDVKDGRKKSA
jgi:hypothetical protein